MNVADSQRVGSSLEDLGYTLTDQPEEADVIVLNTCVVRQSAEDKALGRLSSLLPLKRQNPDLLINLMGGLVGVRGDDKLRARFPFVDVLSPPSDPGPLIKFLLEREGRDLTAAKTFQRFDYQDEVTTVLHPARTTLRLPEADRGQTVCVHIPIVYGCSHACTFCIMPSIRSFL